MSYGNLTIDSVAFEAPPAAAAAAAGGAGAGAGATAGAGAGAGATAGAGAGGAATIDADGNITVLVAVRDLAHAARAAQGATERKTVVQLYFGQSSIARVARYRMMLGGFEKARASPLVPLGTLLYG